MKSSLRNIVISSWNVIPVPRELKVGFNGEISGLDRHGKRRLHKDLMQQRRELGKEVFNEAIRRLSEYAQEWRDGQEYRPSADNLTKRVRIVGETYAKYMHDYVPGLQAGYVAARTGEGFVDKAVEVCGIDPHKLWEFHRVYLRNGKRVFKLAKAMHRRGDDPTKMILHLFNYRQSFDLESILELIKLRNLKFSDILDLGDGISERAAVERSAIGNPVTKRYKLTGVPEMYNGGFLERDITEYAWKAGLEEGIYDRDKDEIIVTGREANLKYFELILLQTLPCYLKSQEPLRLKEIAAPEEAKPAKAKAYVA